MLQLPRAPEAIAAEEEAQQAKRDQQLREEYSHDIRAVTELRRYLRKVVATMIAKSKYTDFLYPMDPDEDPEAYNKVCSLHAEMTTGYIDYTDRLPQGHRQGMIYSMVCSIHGQIMTRHVHYCCHLPAHVICPCTLLMHYKIVMSTLQHGTLITWASYNMARSVCGQITARCSQCIEPVLH